MQSIERPGGKPTIFVSEADHTLLTKLASNALGTLPDLAEDLLVEMERANVLASVPTTVVQMGSLVEYQTDDGQHREVTLVLPGTADIAQGKVSIFTPIGTALIGLSEQQTIAWIARDGRTHHLTVVSVVPPPAPAVASSSSLLGLDLC